MSKQKLPEDWQGWDAWQTMQLVQESPMVIKKVQQDLRFGQVAKAQHLILNQIVGPYNQDVLYFSNPESPVNQPRLIREDLMDWESLFELVVELAQA